MENKEHVLLLIAGKTASGKDSIVNMLCNRANLKAVTSYTTRPRREGEEDTHIFVSEDIYEQMRADNIIAAYTKISGYHYWTTIDQIYSNDIYIIDYEGIKTLRQLNLPNLRFITIFINTPDELREERALNKRRDDKFVFRKRNLDETKQFREMLKTADFDYAVSNIESSKAYSIIRWIVTIEGIYKNKEDATE